MKLKNGASYHPEKMQGMEVIDENVVRHAGMTRIKSKNKTAFQRLLTDIANNNYSISDEKFKAIAEHLLYIPPLKERGKLQMFSNDDSVIIDAYNDTTKRHFDSFFAKKILIFLLNSKQYAPSLSLLIQEITNFYTEEYKTHSPEFLVKWNDAKSGKTVNDESLEFFSASRPDLVNLIKENHFNNKDNLILNLYDFHYLTHAISSLASYQKRHPDGIFEIYNKKSNTYYSNKNRGRISGYGLSLNNPSYHLGIFRSIDKTPYDMRKSSLTSNTTRCPDRLYMEHPCNARQNPLNWLNYGFFNQYNSGYVLGLSGSTLLEARAMIFFILSIINNQYQCKFIDQDFFKDKTSLNHYFLLIISMFVYFEGGHTLSEILTVFEIDEVRSFINNALANKEESDVLSKKTLIFNQEDILMIMKDAFIETAKYHFTLDEMEKVRFEIENPKVC